MGKRSVVVILTETEAAAMHLALNEAQSHSDFLDIFRYDRDRNAYWNGKNKLWDCLAAFRAIKEAEKKRGTE